MFNYCVIMAAGAGKRFGRTTLETPKALIEVSGVPLMAHSLDQIKKQVPEVIVTIGAKGDKLLPYLYQQEVKTVINTNGRGNSWWLFNTILKHINEPVLVLPCDLITVIDFSFIIDSYKACNMPACMVVPVKPIEGISGDFILGSDNKVSKLSRNERSDIYCSGIQVVNPYLANSYMESNDDFYSVWNELIKIRQLGFSGVYTQDWYTINNMDQLDNYNKIRS